MQRLSLQMVLSKHERSTLVDKKAPKIRVCKVQIEKHQNRVACFEISQRRQWLLSEHHTQSVAKPKRQTRGTKQTIAGNHCASACPTFHEIKRWYAISSISPFFISFCKVFSLMQPTSAVLRWLFKCSKNPRIAAQCAECGKRSKLILDKTSDKVFCLVRLEAFLERRAYCDKEIAEHIKATDKDTVGW